MSQSYGVARRKFWERIAFKFLHARARGGIPSGMGTVAIAEWTSAIADAMLTEWEKRWIVPPTSQLPAEDSDEKPADAK